MRSLVRLLAALALSVCTGQPLSAAGDKRELDRTYLRLLLQMQAVNHWADCMVQRKPELARRMFDPVSTAADGNEREQQAREFFTDTGGTCLYGATELRVTGVIGRGVVAQRLIELDNAPLPANPTIRPEIVGSGTYSWTWQKLTPASEQLSLPIAYCLLANHGQVVSSLIATRPVSDSERNQFNAMRDDISACIPAGQQRLLNPMTLRASIAIAWYGSARTEAAAR